MPDDVTCPECGEAVEQPKRGYRSRHVACAKLHEDIERVRRHLEAFGEGTHTVKLTPQKMAELRYELFSLVSELPRMRDALGRYCSSGVSPAYDDAVQRRRRAENPSE